MLRPRVAVPIHYAYTAGRLRDRLLLRYDGTPERFAAAIADDPLLLVLDEPTAAMDVPARRNFWRQIHGFARRGRTVLFATHYLREADDAADRVVVIAAGRKIADAPSPAATCRSRPTRATMGP